MSMVQRRFLFLTVLAGVGFGLFYAAGIWEQDQYAEETRARSERRLFPRLEQDSVKSMTFESRHGEVTVTRSEGPPDSGWRVTGPLSLGADLPVIEGVLAHLKRAEHTGLVGEKSVGEDGQERVVPPLNLEIFGLGSPRYRLTLKTAAGSETLLVGDTNTFNGSLFVKKEGDNRVMTAPSGLEHQVNKSLFDLRDKKLVEFNAEEVSELRVEFGGEPRYQVRRGAGKGEFYLLEPEPGFANQDQVHGILTVLGNLNAKAFMMEEAGDEELKRFGLTTPRLKVTLILKSGPARVILFSDDRSEGKATGYVGMEGGGPILKVVPTGLYQRIAVRGDALLDNHVMRFERSDVTRILLTTEAGPVVLRRDLKAAEENWRMVSPLERDVRDSQVQGIFFLLETMRIGVVSDEAPGDEGFDEALLTTRGLGPSSSRIELWGEDEELVGDLRFGKRVADQRFVLEGAGGRILVVEAERLEGLPLRAEAFKDASGELN